MRSQQWQSAANVDTTEKISASTTKSKDNFSWDNASVYFLLTDRFRNGNTSNDHSYNRGLDQSGKVVSNIDDRATFHGGDFAVLHSLSKMVISITSV